MPIPLSHRRGPLDSAPAAKSRRLDPETLSCHHLSQPFRARFLSRDNARPCTVHLPESRWYGQRSAWRRSFPINRAIGAQFAVDSPSFWREAFSTGLIAFHRHRRRIAVHFSYFRYPAKRTARMGLLPSKASPRLHWHSIDARFAVRKARTWCIWFMIRCNANELKVLKWNSEEASIPDTRHYCGEAHAGIYVSRWLETSCPPSRSDFNRPSAG